MGPVPRACGARVGLCFGDERLLRLRGLRYPCCSFGLGGLGVHNMSCGFAVDFRALQIILGVVQERVDEAKHHACNASRPHAATVSHGNE